MPTINIQNVAVAFEGTKGLRKIEKNTIGKRLVLKNLNMQVNVSDKQVRATALVAESGCGKTTTLQFIAGELGQFELEEFLRQ